MTKLEAKLREEKKKKNKIIREVGQIPAVLYGKKIKNQNLSLDEKIFNKIYQQVGESTLIDLCIGEADPVKVLIQDVQTDSVTDKLVHVDFYQVNMKEKITATIEIEFIGEAPAKKKGGIVERVINELEVKCLPQDLVGKIDVDISGLIEMDDVIRLKDLKIPENFEISEDLEMVIVHVTEATKEEEPIKPVTEEEEGDEDDGEKKTEGDSDSEGEGEDGKEENSKVEDKNKGK